MGAERRALPFRPAHYSSPHRTTAGGKAAVAPSTLLAAAAAVLVATLLYGAYRDWRSREVSDSVWLVGGLAGAFIGGVALGGQGPLAEGLWALVSLFVAQHLIPWDLRVESYSEDLPGYIELAMYLGVGAILAGLAWSRGVGDGGVPLPVLATFVSVLAARGLFEARLLYGGADARAVMVAGLILPLDAAPFFNLPSNATSLLAIYPFSLTLLIDGALFGAFIPLFLAAKNVAAGTFEFPRGFTGYLLPVQELPHRYVWLRDPTFGAGDDEADTTEEDDAMRARQAAELRAKGATEVWVTPQIPYVVLLAAGSVAGILLGNILFDVLALV
ncbi:MAG: prepilin peptidase [Thermoplasmata archaeon]|nr:prepilin peptidase [Thermoplasmata archaeon]